MELGQRPPRRTDDNETDNKSYSPEDTENADPDGNQETSDAHERPADNSDDDQPADRSDGEATALAMAVRRIEFLEQQFTKTMDSIRIIQELEGLPKTMDRNIRPENGGRDLVAVLERLDELEYEYGWIQNSLTQIQEYSGLEQGFFPRLPYRWEGPPPATFRYRGRKYYDHRPAVITPSGRAGTTSMILETTEEDGDWEIVTNELGNDRGHRIHIGKLSLSIR